MWERATIIAIEICMHCRSLFPIRTASCVAEIWRNGVRVPGIEQASKYTLVTAYLDIRMSWATSAHSRHFTCGFHKEDTFSAIRFSTDCRLKAPIRQADCSRSVSHSHSSLNAHALQLQNAFAARRVPFLLTISGRNSIPAMKAPRSQFSSVAVSPT
jgi:hypothetical protein